MAARTRSRFLTAVGTVIAVLAAVIAALLSGGSPDAAPPQTDARPSAATSHATRQPVPPKAAGSGHVHLSLPDAIAALKVEPEHRAGYVRTAFKHWVDADHDGCNTRAEVLLEEAVTPPARGTGCRLTGGTWYSPYDDTTVRGPSGLDIDHRVPLAESWDSGAWQWTAERREAYANDLGDPRSLLAVTAASNRSKGDQDPADWLPPYQGDRCEYVTDWVVVKTRWSLSIDDAERRTLVQWAGQCPGTVVDVDRVP
ncbi:HNH endonuclease family protein [Peterkaempfera bronchialis]|uniref:HNH endonuclease family protein n=1 Tax=Peterkaempfera bronchialis TaxID=2126346 RepID=UPI003C30A7D6